EALPSETIQEIVSISLKGGINWFDSAEIYGGGKSEHELARALISLGKKPGEVIIATKWFPLGRFAGSITRTIGKRLGFLDGFPIDLYQVHLPVSFSSFKAQMNAMAELLREKKIRSVGVSNFSASQMRKAYSALQEQGFDLVSNQMLYSLLDRNIEKDGVLETAKELGITIIAYSPLAQGVLTGKFHDDPERIKSRPLIRRFRKDFHANGLKQTEPLIKELKSIANSYGVTPGQVALNWVINVYGETIVTIPGATRASQAEQNAGAMGFTLSEKEIERLSEISLSVT
ncbi:MAG: aldo/keto reductase, partial [Anaerolineaceae bacterium]|nr:aldo/keto reductase [Anaerolineaceae bacterium]